MVYVASFTFIFVIWLVMVILGEKRGLFSCDRFPNAATKYTAYAWLLLFMEFLAMLVTTAAQNPSRAADLDKAPFYSLFGLHAVLIVFLLGWWLFSGRPRFSEFLNVQRTEPGKAIMTGLAVGVGGWILTICGALLVALLLQASGLLEKAPTPSPMIGFMAGMALWKKALIILSAMTVEEAFFRAYLQKRIGLIASTILFALAHFTLGQPLLLIGVTLVSLVIGATFYRTKNIVPGVIAHGVFDAIQLFIIIPVVFRMTGMGS
jgi:membrane protease YdiL (CAAX protease family)